MKPLQGKTVCVVTNNVLFDQKDIEHACLDPEVLLPLSACLPSTYLLFVLVVCERERVCVCVSVCLCVSLTASLPCQNKSMHYKG